MKKQPQFLCLEYNIIVQIYFVLIICLTLVSVFSNKSLGMIFLLSSFTFITPTRLDCFHSRLTHFCYKNSLLRNYSTSNHVIKHFSYSN